MAYRSRRVDTRMTTPTETKLVEALRPFAAFALSKSLPPDDFVITNGSAMARRQLTIGDCKRAAEAIATYDAAQSGGQTIPAREVCDSYHSILLGGKCQNCGHHFDDHSRPMLHPEQANAGFHSAGMRGAAKEAAREVEQLKDIYRRNRGSNGREYSKEQANAAESVTEALREDRQKIAKSIRELANEILRDKTSDAIDGYNAAVLLEVAETIESFAPISTTALTVKGEKK